MDALAIAVGSLAKRLNQYDESQDQMLVEEGVDPAPGVVGAGRFVEAQLGLRGGGSHRRLHVAGTPARHPGRRYTQLTVSTPDGCRADAPYLAASERLCGAEESRQDARDEVWVTVGQFSWGRELCLRGQERR